ncbi:hypothetical protein ACXJJ3_29540 [Kribbella sp. WER1]
MSTTPSPRDGSFHEQRRHQADRVRVLNALLIPLDDHRITLRRAPDV